MRRTSPAAAALTIALAAPAGGAPIAVPNASFEDVALADGARANALGSDAATVPGWTSVFAGPGVSNGGTHDPQDAQFAGSSGDDAPLPGTADQGQALFLQGSVAGNTESFSSTAAVATVQADTTYTLTVAVGDPLDAEPGEVALQLLVNGTKVAETLADGTTLAEGGFSDLVTTFATAPGDPRAGGQLKIRLRHAVTANGFQQVYVDRVELEDSAVPEPAAALLVATGAALLAGARRRDPR
jgi:hypothetical protein